MPNIPNMPGSDARYIPYEDDQSDDDYDAWQDKQMRSEDAPPADDSPGFDPDQAYDSRREAALTDEQRRRFEEGNVDPDSPHYDDFLMDVMDRGWWPSYEEWLAEGLAKKGPPPVQSLDEFLDSGGEVGGITVTEQRILADAALQRGHFSLVKKALDNSRTQRYGSAMVASPGGYRVNNTTAEEFVSEAKAAGFSIRVRDSGPGGGPILTISKSFPPGDNAAYVECDGTASALIYSTPRTGAGSVWGTTSDGVGGWSAIQNGQYTLNASGVNKQWLKALQGLI